MQTVHEFLEIFLKKCKLEEDEEKEDANKKNWREKIVQPLKYTLLEIHKCKFSSAKKLVEGILPLIMNSVPIVLARLYKDIQEYILENRLKTLEYYKSYKWNSNQCMEQYGDYGQQLLTANYILNLLKKKIHNEPDEKEEFSKKSRRSRRRQRNREATRLIVDVPNGLAIKCEGFFISISRNKLSFQIFRWKFRIN
jgi:hypothetical protein